MNNNNPNNKEDDKNSNYKNTVWMIIFVIAILLPIILVVHNLIGNEDKDNEPANVSVQDQESTEDNQESTEDNQENTEEDEESSNKGITSDGDSIDLASSDYVANCSLLSVDKLDGYTTYGSAVLDIGSSIEVMSAFEVPLGLEDFNILTIDAWGVILDFSKLNDEEEEFDRYKQELQVATQLFSSASVNITPEARQILTEAGCIGVF